ncbi:MAG: hypothetical protein Q8M94_03595, partial [Ignavibacteria bacterium]|nr:hypothetical protein [Ignavibacteria bacterium]
MFGEMSAVWRGQRKTQTGTETQSQSEEKTLSGLPLFTEGAGVLPPLLRPFSKGKVMEDIRSDPSFVKRLKSMDRRLGVKFNNEHFVIVYDRGYGDPVNIHQVKTEEGRFRQPDNRDLEFLKSGDLENSRMKDRLDK